MSWIDEALEAVKEPVLVDTSGLAGFPKTVSVIPLSASEYQVLKQHPDMRGLDESEAAEQLGLRMIFTMMEKCDDSLTYSKFMLLPLTTISALTELVLAATGVTGGGALGES